MLRPEDRGVTRSRFISKGALTNQLLLFLCEWYLNPGGQLPGSKYDRSNINRPSAPTLAEDCLANPAHEAP
jgi:hypothetical protein